MPISILKWHEVLDISVSFVEIISYKYVQNLQTPLHWAIRKNNEECLGLLLSHDAIINVKDGVSDFFN